MIYPANFDSTKNQTMVINVAAEIKKIVQILVL